MSTPDESTSGSGANTPPCTPLQLSELLSTGRPVILDGALATYLETLGADITSALWSASLLQTAPDLIYQTHLDYYQSGAAIAITSSYQASLPGLTTQLHLSPSAASDLIKSSVHLAQRARTAYLSTLHPSSPLFCIKKNTLLVAGSVGPYGAFLADGSEYRGDYGSSISREAMKDFHRGRIEALVDAGCDVLACETIPSLSETEALIELLATEFPTTEVYFSFTLRSADCISDGTSLEDVVRVLEGRDQVVALGVNCCSEELALGALQHLSRLTMKPLVVYPNSGEQWDAKSRTWKGEGNKGERLAEKAKYWWGAGARLIGGCCRTTPDDIRVIDVALRGESRRGKDGNIK
ncbi:Homocysteine S-methyltransferase [Pleomassaria siparia CBS 279.74]|uniref:Homocysteine S-methyltransferase n=1 Tax=Pleomassaria siparia CBS 279.74 TaxID=1314801 RepID=A0A6G1JVK7_9PLEO|nr:Homocysteine S-methyltransferase [Pleomassaria siparia CBS 279.74]